MKEKITLQDIFNKKKAIVLAAKISGKDDVFIKFNRWYRSENLIEKFLQAPIDCLFDDWEYTAVGMNGEERVAVWERWTLLELKALYPLIKPFFPTLTENRLGTALKEFRDIVREKRIKRIKQRNGRVYVYKKRGLDIVSEAPIYKPFYNRNFIESIQDLFLENQLNKDSGGERIFPLSTKTYIKLLYKIATQSCNVCASWKYFYKKYPNAGIGTELIIEENGFNRVFARLYLVSENGKIKIVGYRE